MIKYKRLFKYLFDKYSNTCYFKKISEFDSLEKKKELLSLGELIKMYRDHNVTILNNEESGVLLRLVNLKQGRNNLTDLMFEGFQEFFLQSAIYIHSKQPATYVQLPLAESLKELLKLFEESASKCGESIEMYKGPKLIGVEDKDLVNELNRMFKANPSFILPEGFRKVNEKTPAFYYHIRPSLEKYIPESKRIALEILDEILSTKPLGVHILESTVNYSTKTFICPTTQKTYLDSTDANNLLKRQSPDRASKKLPLSMRLAVVIAPKEMKEITNEVA
jgi:hypothetical protein